MNELIGRVVSFEKKVFQDQQALYSTLAHHGQFPKALMISCADSRIVPEHIMQAQPGDLFVCRNAGNIVPPVSDAHRRRDRRRWNMPCRSSACATSSSAAIRTAAR